MEWLLLALLAVVPALSHYTLDYPPTTGFDEDLEPSPPCGGFNPDVSLTPWPLSGGEIAIDSHHPEMTLIYRAQLIGSDTWINLTDGFLLMTGLGELCINALPVPGSWSGKAGVVQTIGQPPDGILYQCGGVMFTVGAAGTSPLCVNGSVTVASTSAGFMISNDNLSSNFTDGASSTTSSTSAGSTTNVETATFTSFSESSSSTAHVEAATSTLMHTASSSTANVETVTSTGSSSLSLPIGGIVGGVIGAVVVISAMAIFAWYKVNANRRTVTSTAAREQRANQDYTKKIEQGSMQEQSNEVPGAPRSALRDSENNLSGNLGGVY